MKKIYWLQSAVLFIGTAFAWFTVYSDFSRFYHIYGTIIKIKGCFIPNPITTPCFYGSFAFLAAFIWSLYILKKKQGDKIIQEKRLIILLIASTIFAWSNFFLEMFKFYTSKAGTQVSCSGIPTDNIFLTPCFIGSTLFLFSLIVSLIIMFYRPKAIKSENL